MSTLTALSGDAEAGHADRDFLIARAFDADAVSRSIAKPSKRRPNVLPGFGLSLGYTLFYLGLIVLLPLSAAFIKTTELTWPAFVEIVTAPRVMATYRLTFGAAAIAATLNAVFGLLVAWVLVRYRFPGKRLADALVDLPFALPTAVAGIALAGLFSPKGWFGALLVPLGIKVAYTPLGVVVALTFIGLPFVVRSVQPVIEDMGDDAEEAARSLGASEVQTFFRVVFPVMRPINVIVLVITFIEALRAFDIVWVVNKGRNGLELISALVTSNVIGEASRIGFGSALATIMLIISSVFVVIYLRIAMHEESR